jgi:predicted XRE-type DNA-binding protein
LRKEQTKTNQGQETVEPSSGNVFGDLGLENSQELLAKAELVGRIGDLIAERKMTQAKAAKLLGVDQPRISDLLRGRIDGFSADRLFRFLNALGNDVEILVRPASTGKSAETRVIARKSSG